MRHDSPVQLLETLTPAPAPHLSPPPFPSFSLSALALEHCTRTQPLPAPLIKPVGLAVGRAISQIVRAAPAAGTYTVRPHKKYISLEWLGQGITCV